MKNFGKSGCPTDPQLDEQRSESRAATVFRPVLIESDEFVGFCLVRNISPRGMMGEVYTSLIAGRPISVHFTFDRVVRGHITWCKEGRSGIQFDQPINVTAVLSELATRTVEGKVIRAPRVPIQCGGQLIIDDRSLAVELQDISQRGAKLCASFIQRGDEGFLQIRGLQRRKARVRWTRAGMAGLEFIMPFPFEDIALWVIRQTKAGQLDGKSTSADQMPEPKIIANS